jgi:transposase InsO family protein
MWLVIDLFSRPVVGWSMSAAMTAQLVTDALGMAIWRRGKPDALLHHSDRGSQYRAHAAAKRTAPETRRELMYSITSSASTIRNAGIRRSDI